MPWGGSRHCGSYQQSRESTRRASRRWCFQLRERGRSSGTASRLGNINTTCSMGEIAKERTREVPRDDLTHNTERLMGSVDKLPVISLDGLTVYLVGPTSIVSEGRYRKGYVRVLCPFEGFVCNEPESPDVNHEVDLNRLDKRQRTIVQSLDCDPRRC